MKKSLLAALALTSLSSFAALNLAKLPGTYNYSCKGARGFSVVSVTEIKNGVSVNFFKPKKSVKFLNGKEEVKVRPGRNNPSDISATGIEGKIVGNKIITTDYFIAGDDAKEIVEERSLELVPNTNGTSFKMKSSGVNGSNDCELNLLGKR